ncbi:MAG TPA: ornithine cyclodeaminase family protein, partial [Thermoanaerobaculia bacterium]|nr:ornithine cyclodeaminase family protein [Thermoanaerobaculia bacterium]
EAMLLVRSFTKVRVASKTLDRAESFAERASRRYDVAVEAAATAREAVAGADVVCTVTSSSTPVVEGSWLSPGTHINAVGSSVPTARELDTAAVVRSRLFVDRRESTVNEAGDFLVPKSEGALSDAHILGEVGEVAIGRIPGRRGREEITLFKSLGLAVEDVACAHHIYEKARASGQGRFLDLGGERHAAD